MEKILKIIDNSRYTFQFFQKPDTERVVIPICLAETSGKHVTARTLKIPQPLILFLRSIWYQDILVPCHCNR